MKKYIVFSFIDHHNFILELESSSEDIAITAARNVTKGFSDMFVTNIKILNEDEFERYIDETENFKEDTNEDGITIDFDPVNEDYWEHVFSTWDPDTTPAEDFDLKARIKEVEKERQELQKKRDQGSD